MRTLTLCLTLLLFLAPAGLSLASEGRSGQKVYEAYCATCHASGVAGAPKLGDQETWQPRIAQGMEAMLATVESGKGAMPPKGSCTDCSVEELEAAVEYMVEQSR